MRDSIPPPPDILIKPINLFQSPNGSYHMYYPEDVDVIKTDYYKNRIFLIDYIKQKRVINDFLAQQMRKENPDVQYMKSLSNLMIKEYFFLTYPMLDKEYFLQRFCAFPHDIESLFNENETDANHVVVNLQDCCIGILIDRIKELHGSAPAGIFYGEFLRIIDATIDHFSIYKTMQMQQFVNMFAEPPKLMTEQWNPNYSSVICIYPWRAFELVWKLEELMRGKKDKEAMMYVYAAIEAGVLYREWKRFEMQFGTKYCSRKTYDKYTSSAQKNCYYSQETLEPLITFFKGYIPNWAQK